MANKFKFNTDILSLVRIGVTSDLYYKVKENDKVFPLTEL